MDLDRRLIDCNLGDLADIVKTIVAAEANSTPKEVKTGKYMSHAAVIELFGISESTLKGWVSDKLIVKYKVGGVIRYLTSDVEKLVKPVVRHPSATLRELGSPTK